MEDEQPELKIIDVERSNIVLHSHSKQDAAPILGFSKTGRFLAWVDGMSIEVIEVPTGRVAGTGKIATLTGSALYVSDDGQTVEGLAKPGLTEWDLASGERRLVSPWTIPDLTVPVSDWDRDSGIVALGGASGRLQFWNVRKGVLVWDQKEPYGSVLAVALDPAEQFVAAVVQGTRVMFRDMEDGALLGMLRTSGTSLRMAISPDGLLLATTIQEGVLVWELATGSVRFILRAPETRSAAPQALEFSPEGRRLLLGSTSRLILLWDLADTTSGPQVWGDANLERLWASLGVREGSLGFEIMKSLEARESEEVVGFLEGKLFGYMNEATVAGNVRNLLSDDPEMRAGGYQYLEEHAVRALPAMRKALEQDPGPHAKALLEEIIAGLRWPVLENRDAIRRVRAIEVLQRFSNASAQELLMRIRKESPASWERRLAALAMENPERE